MKMTRSNSYMGAPSLLLSLVASCSLLLLALAPQLPEAKAILNVALSGSSSTHRQHHHYTHSTTTSEDVVVKIPLGTIRGVRQAHDGQVVRAFLGVPYAEKPVGSLRFGKPEMVHAWEGEMVADELSKTCYLTPDTVFPDFPGAEMWNPPNEMSEDCLSMNIWVPEHKDGSVMVWIYGGGYFSGSPSLDLYDGRVLAVQERTIVVNINYRLGPFGFLYLGANSPVPGNMGLLDQQLALRWIHENIAFFGGDPRRVTLFGESAGGASATAHMFAPDSFNYFTRVIASSGVASNKWASKPRDVMLDISLSLARRLNCTAPATGSFQALDQGVGSAANPEAIVACLSNISASRIQAESNYIAAIFDRVPMIFPFVPIHEDGNFFRGNLFDKIRKRDFKKDVDLLLGTVKDEGTYWLPYYLYKFGFAFNHTISAEDRQNQALIDESDYNSAFEAFLPYFGGSPLIRHALMDAYLHLGPSQLSPTPGSSAAITFSSVNEGGDYERRRQWRDGVARFLGDFFFTCSLVEFADLMADNVFGSVYTYYFTRRSSSNPWPWWMGAMHGYELEYVFGQSLRLPRLYKPSELSTEQHFAEKIIEMWGRFAKTGQPADYWPKYNRITRKSMVLNEESVRGSAHAQLYVDVHGRSCRLLDEAQTVTRNELNRRHASSSLSTRAAIAPHSVIREDGVLGEGKDYRRYASSGSAYNRLASPLPHLPLLIAVLLLPLAIFKAIAL